MARHSFLQKYLLQFVFSKHCIASVIQTGRSLIYMAIYI